jgi:PBP1b-binding outer membrane lipoprotein LpoB
MKTKTIILILFITLLLQACSATAKKTFIPISTTIPLDSNGDFEISTQELKVTFSTMHSIVDRIAEYQPDEAKTLNAEIAIYDDQLANDFNAMDLSKVKQTANKK